MGGGLLVGCPLCPSRAGELPEGSASPLLGSLPARATRRGRGGCSRLCKLWGKWGGVLAAMLIWAGLGWKKVVPLFILGTY